MKAVVNSQGDIMALIADDAPDVIRVAGAMAYNSTGRQYDQPVNVREYKTTRNRKAVAAAP